MSYDGSHRSFRKSNHECSCDQQEIAEVIVKGYKIFVQNDRGTDKHVLVHVVNGYGEWNIEPLIIPWDDIATYILLTFVF
jgi:hypothetical protein